MKYNTKIDFTEELEVFKKNFKKLRGSTDPGLVLMLDGLIYVMSLMIKVIEELSKKKHLVIRTFLPAKILIEKKIKRQEINLKRKSQGDKKDMKEKLSSK